MKKKLKKPLEMLRQKCRKKKKKQIEEQEPAEEEAEAKGAEEEAKQVNKPKKQPKKQPKNQPTPQRQPKLKNQPTKNKVVAIPSRRRLRSKRPISSEGESPGTVQGRGLTDSRGPMVPERIEYPGPPDEWRRDPRLHVDETAAMRGWEPCRCNGFCRPKCPGRSSHPSYYEGKKQVGCPNPATSLMNMKARCVWLASDKSMAAQGNAFPTAKVSAAGTGAAHSNKC